MSGDLRSRFQMGGVTEQRAANPGAMEGVALSLPCFARAFASCSGQLRCAGFSCCGAWALEGQTLQLGLTGLVAL